MDITSGQICEKFCKFLVQFEKKEDWRRRMGVEPTRERWRPQQDLKSCHITGYDTPPKKWRYFTEFIRIVQNF